MGLLSSRLSAVKKDGRKQSDSVEYHPIASSSLASFNQLTREFSKVGLCTFTWESRSAFLSAIKNKLFHFYFEHLFIIFADRNNKYTMSPRPKNIRKVNNMPSVAGFRPVISNNSCEETIFLHFEEYETIRLCDYEMKTQQEASISMGVSRPTLSRIYTLSLIHI